jgi:hypothetical protein
MEPLAGSLHATHTRCNRANCRCARGELHAPYWRRHWREGDRQHWQYVRAADLPTVRARLEAWRELHPPTRQTWQVLRDLVRLARQEFGW